MAALLPAWTGYPLAALLFAVALLYLLSRIDIQQPDGSWRPLLAPGKRALREAPLR